MITISISFQCNTQSEADDALAKLDAALKATAEQQASKIAITADDKGVTPEDVVQQVKEELESETPKKRGRPKKTKEPEPEIEDYSGDDLDDADLQDEIEEIVEDAIDEQDAKIGEDELKTLKTALRNYSNKNGKDAALKQLFKFAKVSQDVTKEQLPKLLKLLKA